MPHITVAMQRSVRRGVGDAVYSVLAGRDSVTDGVNSVKDSFSSWDNCMQADYCKWPVIAGIIILGLILLSVVTCIIRCACCAKSCCCSCFSFLKCCDCCGGSCDGKKNKPMKHLDDPYSHANAHAPPQQGYMAPPPMMGGALPGRPEPPQYAQFEVGKSGLAVEPKSALNEDALPPMPSWEGAAKKHVPTEEEKNAVELGELDPATGQKMPLMSGAAAAAHSIPPTPSPVHEMDSSPYGSRSGQGGADGYMGVANSDPYVQNHNAYSANGGYRGSPSPGPGMGLRGPGRGYASPSPQEHYSPNDNFNVPPIGGPGRGGRGPNRGFASPPPQELYGSNENLNGAAMGGPGYGRQSPQRQSSNDNNRRPHPPNSRPMPGRQPSNRSYQSDYSQPPPPRGPSRGPGGPQRMASPPMNNHSGLDFGDGGQQPYARSSPPPQQMPYGQPNSGRRPSPPQMDNGDGYFGGNTAPSYGARSPPPQEPAYPGHQPYTPPAAMTPGTRGGREPQGWDPVSH